MLAGILFAVTTLGAVPAESAARPDTETPGVVIRADIGGAANLAACDQTRLAAYAFVDKRLGESRLQGPGPRAEEAGSEGLRQQVARPADGGQQVLPRQSAGSRRPPAARRLFGGVAVVDITPPRGYRMSGYFSERLNTGVHDSLYARAIYFRQGCAQFVLVECDVIGISSDVAQQARRQASALTGIPAERILIAATHSHTGPLYCGALRNMLHAEAVARQGSDPHELVDYPVMLGARLVDVIARARALQEPITVDVAVGRAEGLTFNRRFHMQDGTVRFNPGKLNPHIVRPAGPVDSDASVLLIRRVANGHPLASLTNFALHLDTVGGTDYGADYPFYLAALLRQEFGPSFVSLFATGTCGDLNHIDVSNSEKQHGPDEARRIGTRLANVVKQALRTAVRVAPSIAGAAKIVQVPLHHYTAAEVAQAHADLKKLGTRELPFLKQVKAYAIVSVSLRKGRQLPLEVQAFRVADDVAIVGLPGEIFVELGLAIKRRSPFRTTLVIELCNDAPGYLPTRKAFTEGSYETVNSRIEPGGGEALVEAAVELLEGLKNG